MNILYFENADELSQKAANIVLKNLLKIGCTR